VDHVDPHGDSPDAPAVMIPPPIEVGQQPPQSSTDTSAGTGIPSTTAAHPTTAPPIAATPTTTSTPVITIPPVNASDVRSKGEIQSAPRRSSRKCVAKTFYDPDTGLYTPQNP